MLDDELIACAPYMCSSRRIAGSFLKVPNLLLFQLVLLPILLLPSLVLTLFFKKKNAKEKYKL